MKASTLVATVIFAAVLFAARTVWAQQGTGQYYDSVYKVFVADDNKLYVNVRLGTHVNPANPDRCTTPYYAVSKYSLNDDRTRAWLQIALASLLSHKKVYMKTYGCTGGGVNGYPILMGLQLED